MGGLGLALSLFLILLPACGDGGPAGVDRPDGNGGVSGGDGPTERLVGTWRTVVVVEVPGDIQTWTTTWRFEPDGACHQTVETESLAEGFPRVTERPCTFVARDFDVSITFAGGGTLVFEYSFADFSPDRLILDGFEYERLA
jgi:hypothetical protein